MNSKKYVKILFGILLFFVEQNHLNAQDCDSNYFSFIYTSHDLINFSKSIITQDKSILCLENNNYYPPGLVKFTPQGNIIWANTYSALFAANGNHPWTDLFFSDMANGLNGNCFITGSVTKHGQFFDNMEVPSPKTVGLLMNVDKYGNVVWSKFFFSLNKEAITLTRVITTSDGKIICYLAVENHNISYGKIACFLPDGSLLWITNLNTGLYNCGKVAASIKRSIKQIGDGNIVVGDVVYDSLSSAEFHFFSLNKNTGAMLWESSYEYPYYNLAEIDHISELPDGSLSFLAGLKIATPGAPLITQKLVNIIADNKGNLKDVFAYYPLEQPEVNLVDVSDDKANGKQAILMADNSNKAVLMQIDETGKVTWSKGYGRASAGLPPVCLNILGGYNIFMSDFKQTTQLLQTDPTGNLDCDTTTIQMIKEAISLRGNVDNIHTDISPQDDSEPLGGAGFFVVTGIQESPTVKTIDCQKKIPCCTDVIDTANTQNISLCEGGTYLLPDNTPVKDTGTYYVIATTAKGCDSVGFYKINIVKNPANLMLVRDTCLNGSSSINLHATAGYQNYSWMNAALTNSSTYSVYQPGTYYVTVTNTCGSKTDTTQVYNNCNFPIYMPSAFTPNGDGLNDIYRVPPENINKMVSLQIYNQWGQPVFKTTSKSQGWDGNLNGDPQPTGVYVYYLQMEGLQGKSINQKGSFVLLR